MRIAWIVPGFQGNADEPGIPALQGLARTIGANHDLRVFAVRYPPRAARYCIDGIPVQSFGQAHVDRDSLRRRAASARRWQRVLEAIAGAHRRAPFTVLHGFWATESGMLAALAGRLLGIPALVSCCGGELAAVRAASYGSQLRALERLQVALALHLATRVGVGSMDLRRRLLARYPWLADRADVLPLGYDPAIFAAPPDPALTVPGRIVCVASWSPVKGHALLLDALRLLIQRDTRAHLILVGERTDGPEAREAAARRGLAAHVRHMGGMTQVDVAALLGRAAVAVSTSWHEAQCLAVVEALARGTPVVATPVGIARDLLNDPILGACIPVRTPSSLADSLQWYLRVAHRPDAQVVRRQAVAHLALPRVAERFLATYRLLAKMPAPEVAPVRAIQVPCNPARIPSQATRDTWRHALSHRLQQEGHSE
jgi:glycosyltransferase involved in cell wall biosynthesis